MMHVSRVCLGLLAVASVMANESKEPRPMTAETVEHAQDLYLDRIQERIVAAGANPTPEGLNELWHMISHARSATTSPFSSVYQANQAGAASSGERAARPKSSVERQAQLDIDSNFAKSLKYVAEAKAAVEGGQSRTVIYRLTSASREVAKVGTVLDAVRKRRASQGAVAGGKGQQASSGAAKPDKGSAPARK